MNLDNALYGVLVGVGLVLLGVTAWLGPTGEANREDLTKSDWMRWALAGAGALLLIVMGIVGIALSANGVEIQ